MKKIVVVFILLIIVVFLGILFLKDDVNQSSNNQSNGNQSTSTGPKTNETDEESRKARTTLINKIFTLANQGKIPNTTFIAGQTSREDVIAEWGNPTEESKVESGNYSLYPEHKIDLGYADGVIFDMRSFSNEIHTIHMEDITNLRGNPDDIRYYHDESHDQIILIYAINSSYQLKWILPNPTLADPNPNVHHIAVYSELKHRESDIADAVEQMSLDEKVGQMLFGGISETTLTSETEKLINEFKLGGIIFYANNLETPEQTLELLNQIKEENAQNRFPLFLGVDQEGGRISRLPGNLVRLPTNEEIGARSDENFSFEIGSILGKQLKAFGFNLDFAPVLDVNSNPNNPVIGDRSFGNNPEIVTNLGIQTMHGIQSENIISVVKHFPGHGDTAVDSHFELPKVNKSMEQLHDMELIPFEQAIEHGADVVMVAHILLPKLDAELPASMSEKIISGMLREQLQFNGLVITDDMTMEAITDNFTIGAAAVESVKAGSDMIMVAHDYDKIISAFQAIKAAVEKGEITEERINESVKRIIKLKRNYDINNEKIEEVQIKKLNRAIESILK